MFPAIQSYITECIQQTLAGVTLVEQLFQNYSNNHYQCKNYRNHNSNSTIVCGQSVSKVKTTFLDLLETLGSQLRARWGRDITFYWWRCWCYPEQRLLRDGGWYYITGAPADYTWSDDEAFLSFQGMWWSLLEEFLVVEELSSSVLLDGASNAWIWKFWKRCLARIARSHQDTYRVLDASIRLEHSVHRVAGYPGTKGWCKVRTINILSSLTHRVLFLCFSLLLLWGLEAPKVCILEPPFLSFCRLLIRLSRATSMALRVSLLIGNLAPSMGVSANKKC